MGAVQRRGLSDNDANSSYTEYRTVPLVDATRRDLTPSRVADDDEQGSQVVRVSATLTIPQAAQLLGIGRNLAYEIAARDGEIAGVPVIRAGRRLLIPLARLLGVLGLDDDSTRSGPTR
jgi:hypothetical protein